MTTHITPAEARKYYVEHLTPHVTSVVQLISLQPDDHQIHNVEAYDDGLRVPVYIADDLVAYVYCLPWQRGWSVFASPLGAGVASFSWRTVPIKWRRYQIPVYNPRNTVGPWHCPPEQITAAFEYIVRIVASMDKRRRVHHPAKQQGSL